MKKCVLKSVFLIMIMVLGCHFFFVGIALADEYTLVEKLYSGNLTESEIERLIQETGQDDDRAFVHFFLKGYEALRVYRYDEAYYFFYKSLDFFDSDDQNAIELKMLTLYYLSEIEMLFNDIPNAIMTSMTLRDLAIQYNRDVFLIEANYNLGLTYKFYYDNQQGQYLVEQAYSLSKEIDYKPGIAQYYYFVAERMDVIVGDVEAAQPLYQQAIDQAEVSIPWHFRVNQKKLFQLSQFFFMLYSLDDKQVIDNLYDYYDQIDEENMLLKYDVMVAIGDYYFFNSDFEKSAQYHEKAINYFRQAAHIPQSYLSPYNAKLTLASAYYLRGDFEKAAHEYFKLSVLDEYERDHFQQLAQALDFLDDFKLNEIYREIELLETLNTLNEEKQRLYSYSLALLLSLCFFLFLFIILMIKANKKKSIIQEKLYRASITDPLTKLYNRGKILEELERKIHLNPTVALLDIDDFKKINDSYGHLTGDFVLEKVSETIKTTVGNEGIVGRYGGEEFLIVFFNRHEKSQEEILKCLNRVRENIALLEFEDFSGVTVSMGLCFKCGISVDELISCADKQMYLSKNRGKNQIAFEEELSTWAD